MFRSLSVIFTTAVIVCINILASFLYLRVDFTEGKVYTLSEATKETLTSLEDNLEIRVFLSKELPAQAEIIKKQLQDNLTEYEKLVKGKLKVFYADPASNEEAKQYADATGVSVVELTVIEKDKRQAVAIYMGLSVIKNRKGEAEEGASITTQIEKFESLPVIQNFNTFEYDMTLALQKVGTSEVKTIGFLEGHNSHKLKSQMQNFFMFAQSDPREDYDYTTDLEKMYFVRPVNITEEDNDISDVDTLIIPGPEEEFSDIEIQTVKNFLQSGKNVFFLADQVKIGDGLMASPIEANFDALLSDYGVSLEKKLIQDSSHMDATFQTGIFSSYTVPYPFWVKVNQVNKIHDITQGIEAFVLPWTSPLTLEERPGVMQTVLATTSSEYTLQEDPFNLNPKQEFTLEKGSEKLPLAVLLQKEGEGKMVVVAESDFAGGSFARFPGNKEFFLNVIDGLTGQNDLISIRSKQITDRSLEAVSEKQKNIIIWGNMIIVPVLFILFGLIRRHLRKKKKMMRLS